MLQRDFPRVTGALRAYGGAVSGAECIQDEYDPEAQRNALRAKRKRRQGEKSSHGITWDFLNAQVNEYEKYKQGDLHKPLRDLAKAASDIVGGDAGESAVSAAAASLLVLLHDCQHIGRAEAMKIKQMFGPFPASAATQACASAQALLKKLPNVQKRLQDNEVKSTANDSSNDKHSFGEGIKFDGAVPGSLYSMHQQEWGVKETEQQRERQKQLAEEDVLAITAQQRGYDSEWLRQESAKYASLNPSGLTAEHLATAVFDLLTSSQNDDQLQGQMFDLLGFEAMEFIQTLLANRQLIVAGLIHSSESAGEDMSLAGDDRALRPKMPTYGCQVTVHSKQEKELMKQMRKEGRREERRSRKDGDEDLSLYMSREEMRIQREAMLQAAAQAPLFQRPAPSAAVGQRPKYPFVFDKLAESASASAYVGGAKILLPESATRKNNKLFEEVSIPHTPPLPIQESERRVKISELEPFAQLCFPGTKSLNRIQSICYDAAFNSNQNLLISAPTGAGKTNVAMLTILHEVKQHLHGALLKRDEFKVVYVAPMKALAAEMVRNFGTRLSPLGIIVKELTGDMQLTKSEIMKTQMIVTTPEKWDVITRKGTGDVALTQAVKLLIIDEVHLLHDDRGPVIESLVARTLRQVESTQSMIRIVGLSATLPNYIDVAHFLRVNPMSGLFMFDSRFRPVPLSTKFIGIKSTGHLQQLRDMDTVCYEKALEQVEKGTQVMVFVHARNATLKTARYMCETAKANGTTGPFLPEQSRELGAAEKQVERSRNKEFRELFQYGFGIHHAGMLRQDRNLVEKMFADGFIRVLVCTATLAWGVNLPAHCVIIKGTQIYNAEKGSFVDLGILDVLQIFGRAGRPQFDTFGEGVIITSHDKLPHYLSLLTRQMPIESQYEKYLRDNLNAEIALGTVSTIQDGVRWLNYTYFFVRMLLNPLAYGISYTTKEKDPTLEQHRRDLIVAAARALDKARMIRYNERTEYLNSTDLGRISSHFYIGHSTVETFNDLFKSQMSEDMILGMLSQSNEFSQIKVRDDELVELEGHMTQHCELPVRGGVENAYGKVNILLQSFISRASVESFSLVSDTSYVAQNAGRIMRALFEISLRRGWPATAARLLDLCKSIDHRLWSFQNPLYQFTHLRPDIVDKLEKRKMTVARLRDMTASEIGQMLYHPAIGPKVKSFADSFPMMNVEATCQPITRTVLRVRLVLSADFEWNDRFHGSSEPWWVWVEDSENDHMYYSEYFILHKKHVIANESQELVFTTPIFEPLPPQYIIRVISDRWLGAQSVIALSFKHLILPERHAPHTDLLDLQPLPKTAINNPDLESLYPHFTHFNPVQTQFFHTVYHTDHNVLLGAPTGSGKTVAAELAIYRLFREYPGAKAVYIAPLKALVRERVDDWKVRIQQKLGKNVVELTGDFTPDVRAISRADLIVTTPEKWDGVSRSWQSRSYVQDVGLLVIDEIHLLGGDRGPVLEVIVSRTNFISSHTERNIRIVGLSTALANARDLADWLNIEQVGLYNFRPAVRPVPLDVHVQGFAGKHYCPRMATMNKPSFEAIKTHSPSQPVLIFVSSRRQTRITALDLISLCSGEDDPKQWLKISEADLSQILARVSDANLKLTLAFGIGLHHAGLQDRDRKVVEELFVSQKIQVLIATSTLAWGVNFPAHLVIVKGTEYFDGKLHRYVDFPITDVLQMMGRAGRPQFDDKGVACILVHDIKKDFYKKFLYEPFPVESNLLEVLADHLNAEIVAGTIGTKQAALDYLTWTYFFRRLVMNPSYYELEDTGHECLTGFLSNLVGRALNDLEMSGCISFDEDGRTIIAGTLGRIASYYYLHHSTVRVFCECLHQSSTNADVLKTLCDVHEYAELPVRHNEDGLNKTLSEQMSLEIPDQSFDSSHTKALILLHAHFSRAALPTSDYLTDTKSVLDQALRILQAMIDVVADQGWMATALRCMHTVQMCVQGAWLEKSSLLTLPHVDQAAVDKLTSANLTIRLLSREHSAGPRKQGGGRGGRGGRSSSDANTGSTVLSSIKGLAELLFAYENDATATRHLLEKVIGSQQHTAPVLSVLDVLPIIDVRLRLTSTGVATAAARGHGDADDNEEDTNPDLPVHPKGSNGARRAAAGGSVSHEIQCMPLTSRPTEKHWIPVNCEGDCTLSVQLRRHQASNKRPESRAVTPRFGKVKDEGWWLAIGEADTGELLALKRVGFFRGTQTVNINLLAPEKPGRHIYTVYVMSDCYLGLDQQYNFGIDALPTVQLRY
ncbi:activating signal cointegrator 1 complex subunit 3-like [Sycon ciliatum]|uniref:activating signal cointegrator 1 complex subunit 3-like n=1 Tax=Sycon ciliatum TaxID=27933 RepID=UPI0031F716FE